MKPCDDLLAALVGQVAIFLDVRGFGQVAQLVEPCDDLLGALVGQVAIFLDERVSFSWRASSMAQYMPSVRSCRSCWVHSSKGV